MTAQRTRRALSDFAYGRPFVPPSGWSISHSETAWFRSSHRRNQ